MALDSTPAQPRVTSPPVHVTTPSGRVIGIPEGTRLVFGRGPEADLVIPAGRGLSRRAGGITATAGGAWVANLSKTHALYAEGDGYRIRLPRMDVPGEPSAGWYLRHGTALVGSRAMLDEGQPLRLAVAAGTGADEDDAPVRSEGDSTLLPLYLDPNTKLFLVALMWCRPWLIDPSAYGGHREVDLAMLRLFGAPSERVFSSYQELAPLADGWRERVELYQLLPLLVHALLFGGSYRAAAERVAGRYAG